MNVNTYWRWPKDGEVIPPDVIRDQYGRALVMAEDVKKGDTIVIKYPTGGYFIVNEEGGLTRGDVTISKGQLIYPEDGLKGVDNA